MSGPALPASRFDALGVVGWAFGAVLFGSTPEDDKHVSLTFTALTNFWAIASSVITYLDIRDDNELETHLQLFVIGLLVMTIVSSVLALLSFLLDDDSTAITVAGILASLVGLGWGITTLSLAYVRGCDDSQYNFRSSHFCRHTTSAVIGAMAATIAIGLSVGCAVVWAFHDATTTAGLIPSLFDDNDKTPKAIEGAIASRLSALSKGCLLGAYWFLVDGDLSWNSFQGYDMNWWVSGQWAKHIVAILNNFFNMLPC